MNILNRIMGVKEASELWGLSPDRIKHLCANGTLEARKIGKTWIMIKDQPNPKGGVKMTKIEELQKLIEESGKKLDDRIEFENDGGRDVIIVTDNEAETSDEAFVFESYGPYEALEFLEKEGYLK